MKGLLYLLLLHLQHSMLHGFIRSFTRSSSSSRIAPLAIRRKRNSFATSFSATATTTTMPEYWNREESAKFRDIDDKHKQQEPPIKEARIISLSPPNDPNNLPLEGSKSNSNSKYKLPTGAKLLAVGATMEELGNLELLKKENPNVIFVSPGVSSTTLEKVIIEFSSTLEWIHSRSAGVDVLMSKTLQNISDDTLILTNAKGTFSSTLAEYTMMACSYFAKDLPQLLKQKKNQQWKKYNILELRGATIGIVGYGDIGRSAAKLAKAYGMKVIALRRTIPSPEAIQHDPYCDVVYDTHSLNTLFRESDYVLCSAPLTPETYQLISQEQFDHAKENLVFINVGRGPVVDEEALIAALKDGRLKGAGLDVFVTEPLDESSELWKLDNVLLSPHNMDQTDTFMLESTQFFVEENLPRFLHGHPLLNPVDKKAGY